MRDTREILVEYSILQEVGSSTVDEIKEAMEEYADERVKDVLQWIWANAMTKWIGDWDYVYNEYKRSKGEY